MTTLPRIPSFRLERKRAGVIGASWCIGLTHAVAVVDVVVVARDHEALCQSVSKISDEGLKACAAQVDISKLDQVRSSLG